MSIHALSRWIVVSLALVCASFILHGREAQARVKGPRFDSLSVGCGLLQDRYDQLMEEIKDNYDDLTPEQFDALIQKGRNIVSEWNAVCASTFGNINYLRLPPAIARKLGDPKLVLQPATPSSPPQGAKKAQPRSVLIKKK